VGPFWNVCPRAETGAVHGDVREHGDDRDRYVGERDGDASAADYFSGRDPVLATALAGPLE
jgi:hypothetical protein